MGEGINFGEVIIVFIFRIIKRFIRIIIIIKRFMIIRRLIIV